MANADDMNTEIHISEDEKDVGDLNEIDYHPDLQDLINELVDNNDDKADNENPPSTMEKGELDHFNNPAPGSSNFQPHSSLLSVAAGKPRIRERIFAIQRRK
ncbi:hypothetical protein TNIN_438671 [Trichonephila inaurata madagascariensis]|uniref:Uncharacterized protein n=1 Tax=Trichonephila inaurata madagascariensis TaxID=2747483 RepID=A0A8X6XM28_9ARAC|nr:hypothetical protein TNIN_438671 [Trichonephila inaurata madagascariensis]